MSKFTPGPWLVGSTCEDGTHSVYAMNGDTVAYAAEYGPQSETPKAQVANAKLIAAAPDLLEALQDAEGLIALYANGDAPASTLETISNEDGTVTSIRRGPEEAINSLLVSMRNAIAKATS